MRLKFKIKSKIKSKIILVLPFVFTIILLTFSVFQINSLTFNTKIIQIYEDKLKAVSQENENLTVDFTRINSSNNIQELIKSFGFERIQGVHHIKILEDIVVAR